MQAEKPEKMAKRSSSLPPEQVEHIANEPMFVMETAMKCLYWSFLAYDLHEVCLVPSLCLTLHLIMTVITLCHDRWVDVA